MLTNILEFDVVTVGRYSPDYRKKAYVYPGALYGSQSLIPVQACGGLVNMSVKSSPVGAPRMVAQVVFLASDKATEAFRSLRDRDSSVDVVLLTTKKALFLMERESATEIEKNLTTITC